MASGSDMVERFHSQTQRKVYGKAAAGRNVKNLRENWVVTWDLQELWEKNISQRPTGNTRPTSHTTRSILESYSDHRPTYVCEHRNLCQHIRESHTHQADTTLHYGLLKGSTHLSPTYNPFQCEITHSARICQRCCRPCTRTWCDYSCKSTVQPLIS